MGSTNEVGATGRSKVTLTLFAFFPSLVVILVKCLTGTPVISMSLCREASGKFMGIP